MKKLTIKILLLVAGFTACGHVMASGRTTPSIPIPPPFIVKTAVNMQENVLIITGRHFGATLPTVTFADHVLQVQHASEQEIVASLPPGLPAANYGVTVTTGDRNSAVSNIFSTLLPAMDKK